MEAGISRINVNVGLSLIAFEIDRVTVVSHSQLKASRLMLLNSRVFAHDSSVPASHISNNFLISRNISCLTWSPICLPLPNLLRFSFCLFLFI